jgi:hypothetical protein
MIYAPEGARWLSVVEQDGQLVLWAVVDPHVDLRNYIIRVQTTGDEINMEGKQYIGTTMMGKDGPWFVAHVFIQDDQYDDFVDHRHHDDFREIRGELL